MSYDNGFLQYGPSYNIDSASLKKWRRIAATRELSRDEKREYGESVEQAVKAKQRSEFMRSAVEPGHRHPCASGTSYTTGEEIHAAIRKQQENVLLSYPAKVRRERSIVEWATMYADAMREKRRARCK